MDIAVLTQADYVLGKCGRPEPPATGLSHLYLSRGFIVQTVFPAGTGSPTQTVTKEIVGDTEWCLRGMQISSTSATALSLQVLLPDGRFLINNLQDALQIAGYGSYRYTFTAEKRCPPGSKIQVTFQVTNSSEQQPIAILFDGAYDFLLKGGVQRVCATQETAAFLPRYFSDPSQNIFAPPWQHGVGPSTPPGYEDEEFVYSAKGPSTDADDGFPQGRPGSSIDVTAANNAAIQQIGMDDAEFHIRRVLVEVTEDTTVTSGSVLARLRDGSGYSFCDDYFDVAQYIGSAPFPVDWIIAPNDSVYADLQLVDGSGTGSIHWTMYLDGFKRRKRAA
jgi:hypothetical protein